MVLFFYGYFSRVYEMFVNNTYFTYFILLYFWFYFFLALTVRSITQTQSKKCLSKIGTMPSFVASPMEKNKSEDFFLFWLFCSYNPC